MTEGQPGDFGHASDETSGFHNHVMPSADGLWFIVHRSIVGCRGKKLARRAIVA
jgi:hypothetical protein